MRAPLGLCFAMGGTGLKVMRIKLDAIEHYGEKTPNGDNILRIRY